MLKRFEQNILKNSLFTKTDKLLVAFSGGVDSVVLADLLHKLGYNIELAHCNFQLRGNEAEGDTIFCEQFARKNGIKFHVNYFDTKQYVAQNKLSIQMAARDLRYKWFLKLKEEYLFDYVLTAHHANDNLETLLVNLVRGTGIKGLQGIPEKKAHIVRPLLFATKEELRQYAFENKLNFREDSSNQEVKYKRNFIRHQVVPELKKLNPILEETIHSSVQFFKQASEIIVEYSKIKFQSICKEENNLLYIDINLLLREKQKETLLFEWLYPKHFKTSQIQQLSGLLSLNINVGKQFESASHRLVIDREYIIVKRIEEEVTTEFFIKDISDTHHLPINLSIIKAKDISFSNKPHQIFINDSLDLFPLTLRKWKKGDKFKPFGMSGFKKLSDFFKDQKLSLFEKQQVWILENKYHVIWVVGYRMDDRCRISSEPSSVLKISIEKYLI